jgi:ABC-type glycerol-3-phosphate transport system substrate-binding protein
MNRRTYLRTAGVASLSITGGCLQPFGVGRGERTPSESVTSPVTVEWLVRGAVDARREAVRNALDDFGLPDLIDVEFTTPTVITPDYEATVSEVLSNAEPRPTLFPIHDEWLRTLTATHPLRSVGDLLGPEADRVGGALFDAARRTATLDDSLVALPTELRLPVVYYRRDRLRTAGYDFGERGWPTDAPTWQSFADVIRETVRNSPTRIGYAFSPGTPSRHVFPEWFRSWGGAYFGDPSKYLYGPVGDRPVTVDRQPVVDALRMIETFRRGPDAPTAHPAYAGPITPGDIADRRINPLLDRFEQGEVVAVQAGAGLVSYLADRLGDRLGVSPLPYAEPATATDSPLTGGSRPTYGAWHVGVNPYATPQRQAAARELLKVVATEEFRRFTARELGWLPPTPAPYDDRLSVPNTRREMLNTIRASAESAVHLPTTPVWNTQRRQIDTHVEGVLAGEQSPRDAMERLHARLTDIEAEQQ